jgi:hypothetical protein
MKNQLLPAPGWRVFFVSNLCDPEPCEGWERRIVDGKPYEAIEEQVLGLHLVPDEDGKLDGTSAELLIVDEDGSLNDAFDVDSPWLVAFSLRHSGASAEEAINIKAARDKWKKLHSKKEMSL